MKHTSSETVTKEEFERAAKELETVPSMLSCIIGSDGEPIFACMNRSLPYSQYSKSVGMPPNKACSRQGAGWDYLWTVDVAPCG